MNNSTGMGFVVTFLKATIIGGLMFLLPVVVLSLLLGHAMKLSMRIVQPVFKALPDGTWTAGFVSLAAVLALILVALAAGLFARTRTGKGMLRWFEDSMLSGIPQYQFAKSMAEGLTKMEDEQGVKPALVSIEDGWQLGYLLMEVSNGWVAVFLPQAPTPMSGNIMYFPADRVRKLDITMVQAMSIIKRMGAGSREALEGVALAADPR